MDGSGTTGAERDVAVARHNGRIVAAYWQELGNGGMPTDEAAYLAGQLHDTLWERSLSPDRGDAVSFTDSVEVTADLPDVLAGVMDRLTADLRHGAKRA